MRALKPRRPGWVTESVLFGFVHVCAALIALSLALSSAAQQPSHENRSRSFGPDSCGPADPTYIRNATETGGLPMFLQRSEAAKAFHLVRESTKNNVSTVLWATGSLASGSREFTVPVDSTMHSVTVALSVDTKGSAMTFHRPSGEEVVAGPAGVEITELNCGRFVTVNSPAAGDWHVRLKGAGRFWMETQATSEIFLVTVEFVQLGGRFGHEGYFKIPGQPLAGKPAMLRVNLSGSVQSTEFHFMSEAGELIRPFQMRLESHDRDDQEFFGEVELPSQPFRVAVSGLDPQGKRFQRFDSPLFRAQTVAVFLAGNVHELVPGKTSTLSYTVHNLGEAATFRIVTYDSRKFVTRVEPMELTLARGTSGNVAVDFTVPAGTSAGASDTFVITAASAASPEISNSNVQEFPILARGNSSEPQ